MSSRFIWVSMTFLALLTTLYAGAVLFEPAVRAPLVNETFLNTPTAIIVHIGGGLIALAIGAFQLNSNLRIRFIRSHRWLGRLYVPSVLAGGTAGLYLALYSFGGLVAHLGFGLLAIFWISSTLVAFLYIRRCEIQKHRTWMIRSYALTLAAVTLRLYIPLSQILGLDFESSYQAISWLCWVPNAVLAEIYLKSHLLEKTIHI